MTTILQRGDRVVGTFTTNPYSYTYDGDDNAVQRILDSGPPTAAIGGGSVPDTAEVDDEDTVHVDTVSDLSETEQREQLALALRATGLRVLIPDDQ